MVLFIEEVMNNQLITIEPEKSVLEALHLLRANRIRHLPVVSSTGKLVGIVSDRDLRDVSPSVLFNENSTILQNTKVAELMIEDVIVIHPLDYLEDAARLMYDHRIGCLPVTRQQQVVGIITETDLLRSLIELTGSTEPGSTLEIRVPERYGPLAEITQIVKKNKVSIASCFIMPDRASAYRLVVMRLKTIDPANIIKEIQQAGFQVLRPHAGGVTHE